LQHGTTDGKLDYLGGALMVLLGLGAVILAKGYQIGSLTNMGPGFFPVAVGVILALSGCVMLLQAAQATRVAARSARRATQAPRRPAEWRGWTCILVSIAAFVVLGTYGGLLPATFAIVFIAALGDRQNSLMSAASLAVAMTLVAWLVFWWALQVSFPLFTWG
jgi:Tripartite tricarboxylate transporter TctB family